MARPKKGEEKAKEAASLMVSVEDFIRTRDSVGLLRLLLFFSSRFALTHSRRDDKHCASTFETTTLLH